MTDFKKTVTFLRDVSVDDAAGNVNFKAKKGEVVELSVPSARRWLNRGACVYGEVKPKKAEPAKEEKAPEKTTQSAKDKSAKPKEAKPKK